MEEGDDAPQPLPLPTSTPITVVTHSGKMHADEVYAVATLSLIAERKGQPVNVVRTRQKQEIDKGDIVVDVGGSYDPSSYRFDHHQPEGAGFRARVPIPYAAFGLVWRHFGMEACEGQEQVWRALDDAFVVAVDAADNGVSLCALTMPPYRPYVIQDVVASWSPAWDEATPEQEDAAFQQALAWARQHLARLIAREKRHQEGLQHAREHLKRAAPIAVLPAPYPYEELASEFPDVLVVVRPRSDGTWQATAMPAGGTDPFARRAQFPSEWAGKAGNVLAEVSGVADAVFCHRGRWMCVAQSKEGALALARAAAPPTT